LPAVSRPRGGKYHVWRAAPALRPSTPNLKCRAGTIRPSRHSTAGSVHGPAMSPAPPPRLTPLPTPPAVLSSSPSIRGGSITVRQAGPGNCERLCQRRRHGNLTPSAAGGGIDPLETTAWGVGGQARPRAPPATPQQRPSSEPLGPRSQIHCNGRRRASGTNAATRMPNRRAGPRPRLSLPAFPPAGRPIFQSNRIPRSGNDLQS